MHDVKANTFKSHAYSSFKRFFGADMSLTTVDHRAHAFRRRVNASALTPAAVRGLASRVTPHVDYLVQALATSLPPPSQPAAADAPRRRPWGAGRDMGRLVAYCLADVMGDVTFSQHFNTQRAATNRHYVHDLPKGVAGIHLVGHMQSLFVGGLHKLLFRELIAGIGSLMALSRSFAHRRLAERAQGVARGDIWQALLASSDPKTGRGFTDEELVSEASLFIMYVLFFLWAFTPFPLSLDVDFFSFFFFFNSHNNTFFCLEASDMSFALTSPPSLDQRRHRRHDHRHDKHALLPRAQPPRAGPTHGRDPRPVPGARPRL